MAEFKFLDDVQLLFPKRIETKRLVLEAVAKSDISARDVYQVYSSDAYRDAMEYISSTPHWSMKETSSFIQDAVEAFETNENASYYIFEKDAEVKDETTVIGGTGFNIDWEVKEAELFIWLLPSAQQNGYSVERGEAFLELLFDELELRTVRVKVLADNNASQKAVESYVVENGGEFEGTVRNKKRVDSELCDLKQYSITYSDWYHNTE